MEFYKTYSPPSELKNLVRKFEVYHKKWEEGVKRSAPVITCLANTEQNLYFYTKDPIKVVPVTGIEIPIPPAVVTGPKNKPVGLMFGNDHLMIKCAFFPTALFRLCGIDMQQTVNTGIPDTKVWGEEIEQVLTELRTTGSYDEMAELAAAFIIKKYKASCKPEEPIDEVAIQMLDPLINYSLEDWASMACLSLRQFERNFFTRTGLSPKLFIRIVRFEHAMHIKSSQLSKSWSQTALETGYTDSSHLLKEFKEFAEFTPGKFYLNSTSGYSAFPTG